jgi:DNA-binding response OmpR family regulator
MAESTHKDELSGVDLDQLQTKDRPRVLVIDDEPDTVLLLKHIFQREGFDVSGAYSGKEALVKLGEVNPSLILLDVMMPEMDGWATFEQLHKLTTVPVIVISALGQTENVVKALQMGVDDYVTKPFNSSEVIARSQAVLRRAGSQKDVKRMVFPDVELVVDLDTQEIYYKNKHIQLTGKMYEVLLMLARGAPRVVTYNDLTMQIWGETNLPVRNRLKYLVYLLRQELEKVDSEHPIIKNVDRLGYKLLTEK